ncbi:MAG TPA: FHA domain-containing protein [Steroidobacteraceae bacterium]|nr:FHA domain-containing protein [Steroidobacteraceae bacterium]
MPPVKTVASSSDVDNDATAELPVLDVAAYEAALGESISNTDTWTVPAVGPAGAGGNPDATGADAIPTLQAAAPEDVLDLSGTHEMPAFKPVTRKATSGRAAANKITKATPVPPAAPTHAAASPPAVVLPPSPPLIEELRGALAAAERRIEQLNEWARIADAERVAAVARVNAENAQLREQLGEHLESLQSMRGRLGVGLADLPAMQDELFARADRIAGLERELAVHSEMLVQVRAALDASEQRAMGLDAEIVNLRAGIARRDAQIGTLEADLAARQQREQALRERLEEALAAVHPAVPDLRQQMNARDEQIRKLNQELAAAQALAAEKNADLEVAEENIRNLELELRDKTGKLEEANVTVEEWRAVIAESQRSIAQRDGRIQQLEADLQKRLSSTLDTAAQTGEEVALEGPARVLIRTDGNTDFVHVLGRRTRIGRGSDNELVIDTKHVSRYHAVLLAGPVHTSIEDLNSTNGVFVNGKRVARQVLKDGDRVTIGRTQFRFTVRT